jgi:hypothetical protein
VALLALPVVLASPAGAVDVGTADAFVAAFEDEAVTEITLTADLTLPPDPTRPLGAPPLVIEGNGFTLTGSGDGRVLSAFNPTGALTVRDITITGGTPDGGQGAGIAWGGPVTVEDSVITGNHAYLSGGGVYAIGSATILRSTIAGNSAATDGAAIEVQADEGGGTASITDSTISGHTDDVLEDGPSSAVHAPDAITVIRSSVSGNAGVALDSDDGPVTVVNSTVVDNERGVVTGGDAVVTHATFTGHVLAISTGGNLTMTASVVGESAEVNCSTETSTSGGYNLVDDESCLPEDPRDLVGDLALGLGPLADNGGTTLTRLPGADSPAIDLYDVDGCVDLGGPDQRGTERPQGDGCDAGAVERSAADATPVPVDPTPTPPAPPAPSAQPVAGAPSFTG